MNSHVKAEPIAFNYRGIVRVFDIETSTRIRRRALNEGVPVSRLVKRLLAEVESIDSANGLLFLPVK